MFKEFQKIPIYWAVLTAGVFIFILFYYLPLQHKVLASRAEVAAMEIKIQSLESLMDNDKSVSERVRIFRDRVETLRDKFPAHETEALKTIAKQAPKFNLTIVSMQSRPPTDVLDESNQALEIEGKKCRSVLVTFEVKGNFKNFLKFVDRLRNELPYFTVHRFSLTRDAQSPGQLAINFELNIYLLL